MAESSEDIDLDVEWQKQWKKASEEFAFLTGGKQLNATNTTTPEQVVQLLNQKAEKDGHSQKWEKLAASTGKLVLKLANVGVSVAAMFFGPAQQCINAVNFLAEILVSYHKIFENLETLFNKIAEALERFELYRQAQKILAKHIKNRANQILIRLVNVCGLAHRLLESSKSRKLKSFAQHAFFKDDQGVAAEIKALEDLAQRELANNVIETVIQSSTTAIVVQEILAAQKKAEVLQENDKQLPWLEECLSKVDQHELWRRCIAVADAIPDSGAWMQTHETFQTWLKSTQSSHRVLLLNGIVGSGKTVLLTQALTMVQKVYSGTAFEPICAFHYLKSGEPLGSILRALAIQIARSDPTYRKSLYGALQSRSTTNNLPRPVVELFQLLFMANANDRPIFLLLDDIHIMDNLRAFSDLLEFLNGKHNRVPPIKFILTSRLDEFSVGQLSKHILCHIDVGQENKDINQFIRQEIGKLPFLQGQNATKQELRKEISGALSEQQSFNTVILILNEIRDATLPTTIRKILAEKSKTGAESGIQRMMQRASELPEEDIEDLCALLEWVMCLDAPDYKFVVKRGSVYVNDLSVLLQSRHVEQSLKPLGDRLKNEFHGFFNVSDASEVSLAFKGIKEYFEGQSSAVQAQEDKQAEALTTKTEVRIVRRLLKNMCDQEMYSRLGFDAFFDKKLEGPAQVYVNTEKMFARVALDMLNLCKPAPQEMMALQYISLISSTAPYWWIISVCQVDLSLLDQDLKHRLGKAILPMLCVEKDILRWQWANFNGMWIFDNKAVSNLLVSWLQDSAIRKIISPEERSWVQQVLNSPQNSNREVLLPILRVKSKQWLYPEQLDRFVEDGEFKAFRCIRAFLDRVKVDQDFDHVSETDHTIHSSIISAEGIEDTAAWVKQILGIEQWSYTALCLLADTFQFFNYHEEAAHYYKIAQELDKDSALAILSEAKSTFESSNKDEAIDLLRLGICKLEVQDPLPSELLLSNRFLLAKWQESVGRWEEAITTINHNLNQRPDHHASNLCKLEIYANHGGHQDCLKVFEELTMRPWETSEAESGEDDSLNEAVDESKTADTHELRSVGQSSIDSDEDEDRDTRIVDGLDMFLNVILIEYSMELLDASTDGGKFHSVVMIAKAINFRELMEVRIDSLSRIQDALGRPFEGEPPEETDDAYDSRVNCILSRCCLVVYRIALLYQDILDEKRQKKAIEECEQAIYAWNSTTEIVRSSRTQIEERLTRLLSFQYLEMAKLKDHDTRDELFWIRKVKKLWTVQCTFGDKEDNQYIESWLMAGYFLSRGHQEQARDCVRYKMSKGLDLLSEEHLDSKFRGYSKLAAAFIQGDSEANTLAAFSLAGRTWHLIQSEPTPRLASAKDTQSVPDVQPYMSCDGGCGYIWPLPSDIYVCKTCADVWLDASCHARVVAANHLPWLCHPKHEFLHVPAKDPASFMELDDGMVRVGEEVMEIEAWIATIRNSWGVPA